MSNDSFKANLGGASFFMTNAATGVIAGAIPASAIYIAPAAKGYNFTPQDDITPLEAVWCAHFFTWRSYAPQHPQWQLIERHFTEVK